MRVSEIRVKRICVNQGLGVYGLWSYLSFECLSAPANQTNEKQGGDDVKNALAASCSISSWL